MLNTKFHEDIIAFANCRPEQFLPYIQPYEFEALLFRDVPTLTGLETDWPKATAKLQAVRDGVETPEHINDGPETKPAAHLKRHLTQPIYSKTLHGPIAASLIGLARIEHECRFFAAWLKRLRNLTKPRLRASPAPALTGNEPYLFFRKKSNAFKARN